MSGFQQDQSFNQYVKNLLRGNGVTGKLIIASLVIGLFFGILMAAESLFQVKGWTENGLMEDVKWWFAAPGDLSLLLYKPWSVITQLFTHGNFMHLAFNMIALYFIGRIFLEYFPQRKLAYTYFLGGIFAYLIHVGAYYAVPAYAARATPDIVGASGSIMAIFSAVAFYRPNMKLQLFLIPIQIPIFVIFILYIFADLRGVIDTENPGNTAHWAHLGGAIFGGLSVIKANSVNNIMNRFDRFWKRIKNIFSFKRKPKMRVHKNPDVVKTMSDEEYNFSKSKHEERINAILDKINKKGYEGLTKEEKEILFNESKRK